MWSKLSITGYIWDIIRNLIIIFVIVLIYGSVYGSFETIVISLLILIYITVIIYGATLTQSSVRNTLQTYSQGVETRKQLGGEETEEEKEEFEEAGYTLEKVMYKFYINSSFHFIVFVIVIFNLLSAL